MPSNLACNICNRTFPYAAKKTLTVTQDGLEPKVSQGEVFTVEVPVCPYCYTPYIAEAQPQVFNITSVKSVDLAQVDEYLAQGYTVKELYAKTATLVKLSPVEAT